MLNKILKFIWIERKIKCVEFDNLFKDFYDSDIWDSQMIKEELGELIRKVKKSGIMQEFNWNSYSLEIYPDLVVIINNWNNKIAKSSLDYFVKKMKEKRTKN